MKKAKPGLGYSPLTDRVYFVDGKKKIDVTDSFIYCVIQRWKNQLQTVTDSETGEKYDISVAEVSGERTQGKKNQKYRKSGMVDKNGVEILEGSIINADGYKSRIEENHFHCVFYENGFYSDIYGDADPLTMYQEIEVVGHAEDFRHIYENEDWSGNLGEGLKGI